MCKSYLLTLVTLAGLILTPVNSWADAQNNVTLSNSSSSKTAPRHHNSNTFKIGNTVYKIEVPKAARIRLTNSQVKRNLRQMRSQTICDIDVERANHLSTSIKVSRKLNRLATLRARQVSRRFSHYSKNGTPMTSEDARRVGLPKDFQGSENIASSSLGRCTEVADPKVYHNHNGRDMANMSNDGMMYHDEFERNGHRKNILDSDNSLIGVGAAYSAKKHTFYLVEDFGNQDDRSSENVDKAVNRPVHLKSNRYEFIMKRLWHHVQRWCLLNIKKFKASV